MIRLSAFADEISPDPDEQLAVLRQEGIDHLELRSAWGTNVLELSDGRLHELAGKLEESGIGVSAIGSPIGKAPVDSDLAAQLRRFDRALEVARRLAAPYVRLFSFYPPEGATDSTDWTPYRPTIAAQLREMAQRAADTGIVLLHENEKDIYGDTIERCVDLLREVDSPHFRAAFDPANFIQCGQAPYPDAYDALRPWIAYVHVKDVDVAGRVVAAGEGIGNWPALLRRLGQDGYDGYFSLEPHLTHGGRFSGFSGPELFRHASHAFQQLARQNFAAESGYGQ
ncbi:MAG TPA: sugar phosphate isomerase/epimerase family protein [Chloroflexota bacterium]|nr:sugar phosphate isomerase/epimerase family protein [Chloroflexota bacterium]